MNGVLRYHGPDSRCTIENAGGIELHCGCCFEILFNGKWVPVRIEHGSGDWFIVGLSSADSLSVLVHYLLRF